MPVIKVNENKSLWESICEEFEIKKKKAFNTNEDITNYDPAIHHSVFYGQAYQLNKADDEKLFNDFDPAISHPACFGYSMKTFIEKTEETPKTKTLPNKNKCTEREYLEQFIFPILLPALEKLLAEARNHKCFERKRTAFNACDFITEYLYKNNPNIASRSKERETIDFLNIPFVKEWLAIHPRKPLPKSLIWTDEEAAIKIQSFFRGYLVRCDPEVQELRKWQRELREDNQNIVQRVEKFWNDMSGVVNNQKHPSHAELLTSLTSLKIN